MLLYETIYPFLVSQVPSKLHIVKDIFQNDLNVIARAPRTQVSHAPHAYMVKPSTD